MSDTPETDAKVSEHIGFYSCATVPAELCRRMERERDELLERNAKLRDIAERAIELALAYYDGPCERDGAKLRIELDQLKEGAK